MLKSLAHRLQSAASHRPLERVCLRVPVFLMASLYHFPWECNIVVPVSHDSVSTSVAPPAPQCLHAGSLHTSRPLHDLLHWQHPYSDRARNTGVAPPSGIGKDPEIGVACQLSPCLLFPTVRLAHVVPILQCP